MLTTAHPQPARMRSSRLPRPILGSILLVVTVVLSSCWTPNPQSSSAAIGTNLTGVIDYSHEVPFADLVRSSRAWVSGTSTTWGGGPTLAVDANDWPTAIQADQIARLGLRHDGPGLDAGDYHVTWEGDGDFEFWGDISTVDLDLEARTGTLTVVEGANPLWLFITDTDQADPLRNFSVVIPGGICLGNIGGEPIYDQFTRAADADDCAAGYDAGFSLLSDVHDSFFPFNPDFLASIRDYRTLRFMDWMGTNSSEISAVSDLSTDASRSWSSEVGGPPMRVMMELANLLDADAWINIPHAADNSLVQHLATEAASYLKAPDLAVYPSPERRNLFVEYSNEVWNTAGPFEQSCYAYLRSQGQDPPPTGNDCAGYQWGPAMEFYAQRATEIHDIFATAFASHGVVMNRVLASQAGHPHKSEVILATEVASGVQAGERADVLAIAPYFGELVDPGVTVFEIEGNPNNTIECGSNNVPSVPDITNPNLVNDHIQAIRDFSVPYANCLVEVAHEIAQGRNVQGGPDLAPIDLELHAYEGGQHLVGVWGSAFLPNDPNVNARYDAINRHPMMRDIYREYFQGWRDAGGDLMVHFTDVGTYSQYGRWGIVETLGGSSPKLNGLRDFEASVNGRWWTE